MQTVMHVIRKSRKAVSRESSLKLEAGVERAFRQFCRDDGMHRNDYRRGPFQNGHLQCFSRDSVQL